MYKMMQKLGLNKNEVEVRCSCKGSKVTIFFCPRKDDYLTCSRILCTLVHNSPRNIKIGTATLMGFNTNFFMKDFY